MYDNRINLVDELQQDINKHRPLSKDVLKQLREYYKIAQTYTSNAIEGNSLTESETKIIIEEGITIGGKPIKDHVVRNDYIDALKASNKVNNVLFINFISNMVYESQQDYLRLIRTLNKK